METGFIDTKMPGWKNSKRKKNNNKKKNDFCQRNHACNHNNDKNHSSARDTIAIKKEALFKTFDCLEKMIVAQLRLSNDCDFHYLIPTETDYKEEEGFDARDGSNEMNSSDGDD